MKKNLIYGLCALFVLVALIVSLVFVFGGNITKTSNEKTDITGTWVVAAVCDNGIPTFTEKQFAVFTTENAFFYKNDLKNPYATSNYTVNDKNQLTLTDISKVYKIDAKTNNCICFYETGTNYMLLIKNQSSELEPYPCTIDTLNGKWEIKMKGDQFNNGEILNFDGNIMSYYKDATAGPTATTSFELSDTGILYARDLGMSMRCYVVSDNLIIFIEESGVVWEMVRVNN